MAGPKMSNGSQSLQTAGTPQWLYDAFTKVIPCGIDVAASAANTKCSLFYSEQDDALKQDWHSMTNKDLAAWCNHPYADCGLFVKKAREETDLGATILQLQPAALHRVYYKTYIKGGP